MNNKNEIKDDKPRKLGYVRVSTVEQNIERQKSALAVYKIDKWYVDTFIYTN